jgi:hypothetical protein
MSGRYLEKLRALKSEKGAVEEPTKLTEPCFVGFVSTQGVVFSNFAARYSRTTMVALEADCPDLVPVDRWQLAVQDGRRFLARWSAQAEAFGWTAKDLFGLITVPEHAKSSFNRLSRYDETGLIWLLDGRRVVALTEGTAAIQNPATASITMYRRHDKPAFGPLGDSLEDFTEGLR